MDHSRRSTLDYHAEGGRQRQMCIRDEFKSDRYGTITRDPLRVGLQNHAPIERPAQDLSFDTGGNSVGVQLLNTDPLARTAAAPGAAASSKVTVMVP